MHRSQIDIIDTAHIDSSHFCTVRHLAECKCFDTACRAELVTNNVFVEKIFLCFPNARRLREFRNRRKSENQSTFFAN